jgi:hypothetical protein
MIVDSLADDFATTNNDRSMAISERRVSSLLKAKSKVVVSLHGDEFDESEVLVGLVGSEKLYL